MTGVRLAAGSLALAGAVVLAAVDPAVSASASHRAHRVPPGTAAATADVLGITPAVSGLTLTSAIGESSAAYQHSESQAKSGTLDLGSLGLVLATSQFCGRPELPSSEQPQPLTVDSEHGARHLTHGAGGLGIEDVSAGRSPVAASATTTTINQSVPGVLSIRGQSHAAVHYLAGREQVALSSVTEDVTLLGGQVRLDGMSWTASRRSGAVTDRSTHFSFGQVTIAGRRIAAPDSSTAATIAAINKALAPAGLSVLQPAVTTNSQTGAVAIGPLTLRFSGSPVDRTVLGPGVSSVIAVENLIRALGKPGNNCADVQQLIENAGDNGDTLINVVLEISEGAGALDLQFGGVAAAAMDQATYANPFGSGGLSSPVVGAGPSSASATRPHAVPPLKSPTDVAGGTPSATAPALASSAVHCVSESPSTSHGCWKGIATAASAGALAVGVGLLGADIVLSRRRRNAKSRGAEASE